MGDVMAYVRYMALIVALVLLVIGLVPVAGLIPMIVFLFCWNLKEISAELKAAHTLTDDEIWLFLQVEGE